MSIVRFSYFVTIGLSTIACFINLDPLAVLFVCIFLGTTAVFAFLSLAPRTIRSIIGLQFALAVFISLPLYNWPMRIKFALSAQALNHFANELNQAANAAGTNQPKLPRRCGLFTVERIRKFNGQTWLITAKHISGSSGLLYHPQQVPAPINEATGIQLAPEWRYTWSD